MAPIKTMKGKKCFKFLPNEEAYNLYIRNLLVSFYAHNLDMFKRNKKIYIDKALTYLLLAHNAIIYSDEKEKEFKRVIITNNNNYKDYNIQLKCDPDFPGIIILVEYSAKSDDDKKEALFYIGLLISLLDDLRAADLKTVQQKTCKKIARECDKTKQKCGANNLYLFDSICTSLLKDI